VNKFNRKDILALVLLVGLVSVNWLPRLRGPIDLRWDGGIYYILGTSLAQGHGYRLLNEPGDILETQYPPMLPAVVAAHQLVLGTSDFVTVGEWLRRSYFLMSVIYAIAVYLMIRRFLPIGYATLASSACLSQVHSMFMSDLCFPEIPFGIAAVLFVLCNVSEKLPWRNALSATVAVIAFALRTVAVALLAAWACESLCRREFKTAAMRMLIGGALVLGWSGYIAHVESGREYNTPAYEYQRAAYNYSNVSYARNMRYRDPFSPELGEISVADRFKQFVKNIGFLGVSVGESFTTKIDVWLRLRKEVNERLPVKAFPEWAIPGILTALSTLIAGGVALQLWRRQYLIPFYILCSWTILCSTPWPTQFIRYLTPLTPFLSLSLFLAVRAGAEWCSQWLPAYRKAISIGLAGAVAALTVVPQLTTQALIFGVWEWHFPVEIDVANQRRVAYRLFGYEETHRATDAGLDWLKRNAKSNDIVATTDPGWAYLRTGLKSVIPPFELDPDKAQRLLDGVPVRYLIVDEGNYKKYTTPVVAKFPNQWRRVFANSIRFEGSTQTVGRFEIYERIDDR
jgi:hypothetical protein